MTSEVRAKISMAVIEHGHPFWVLLSNTQFGAPNKSYNYPNADFKEQPRWFQNTNFMIDQFYDPLT